MKPTPQTHIECFNRLVLQGLITAEQAQRAAHTNLAEHDAELRSRPPAKYTPEEEARLLRVEVPLDSD